jgi:hypothetical protein
MTPYTAIDDMAKKNNNPMGCVDNLQESLFAEHLDETAVRRKLPPIGTTANVRNAGTSER